MDHENIKSAIARLTASENLESFDAAIRILVAILSADDISSEDKDKIVEVINLKLSAIAKTPQKIILSAQLPLLLELLTPAAPDLTEYQNALENTLKQSEDPVSSPDVFFNFQSNVLLLQSVTRGVDSALSMLIKRLMKAPANTWATPAFRGLGASLSHHRWFVAPRKQTANTVKKAAQKKPDEVSLAKLMQLTEVIGFARTAPYEWLEMLFKNLILPTMNAAIRMRQYDQALALEWLAYAHFTKAKDNAEHFKKTVGSWTPLFRKGGKTFGARLPKLNTNANISSTPRVAFYLHNSAILGHTEALLSFFRGLSKLDPRPIEAIIYISGDVNPQLDAILKECGIEAIYVSQLVAQGQPSQNLLAMRRDAENRGVIAFVYVSLVISMPFAFSLGMAPVQIWWSMKYHSLRIPEIDGYIALGSFDRYRQIDGHEWRVAHRAMEPLFDPALTTEAANIRKELLGNDYTLLVGCIGREEKMISDAYIRSLSRILKAVPTARFLWTGASAHPEVLALLDAYDIADRCHYIGWVNTRLYAQVIDVFIDSYPFASGLTAFEAMAAGRPVVSMITREALGTGMPAHVWPVYKGQAGTDDVQKEVRDLFTNPQGQSLLPFAETVETYENIAIQICTDDQFRNETGNAGRLFVERYMNDDRRMAETGCQHIREIISEKLAQS